MLLERKSDDRRVQNANYAASTRGKVFVFTGILPLLDTDDAMASVLGHEIAHNIARHSSERMSQSFLLIGIVWALAQTIGVDGGLSQMILDLAFTRPGSRKQEVRTRACSKGAHSVDESCSLKRIILDYVRMALSCRWPWNAHFLSDASSKLLQTRSSA